ncbi:hypothetical protein HBI56_165190 [Parastagonospora nodorum]|uniref:Uncharacterized protein n=2 Tax=Phaeosphaeria nodorum (strain SN15 / ATCC MYA-4574 / FGSC 10173) TaxID=321614 RepID=A0A7U2IB88_PHANO|nr:hypothetical protein SNOG_13563 [Parastagonospora nodorum SN15]KAH3915343.1 hypothetical protein HBH56_072940 [Parastagonospora nodorum]EAT79010.1 hypothetical protein SNOG_13563 [Parastagonospora nodorum SN15]KAH3927320.1 hypothetical protein HBH54_153180 [Parastagonospora nodorum]KAH4024411.1 hypothetical protein HBI09_160410 [Parastagonospora nodorum]KAH4045539.1 hypothetical protein HBH49_199010 [Parastagonospora nodorum]
MTPAPIATGAVASPTPPQQQKPTTPATPVPKNFDDIFHAKFMYIIQEWKNDPQRGQLTQRDRKAFIESAYVETDESYFNHRHLSDQEIKLRALTKVFYKVLAEEPWSEDWIRAPDVERKLSKFEMNKDTMPLAIQHGLLTPRDAVKAAREAAVENDKILKENPKKTAKELNIKRGPYDEIEIVYIAGTVSSTATNRIDRDNIYPVSVSSVANVLQNHICRDMVRPFTMAERFLNCTETKELEKMRKFACDVCDFAPHLLDNDNVSLLVVLLILSRSDCCRRFENNGIRIEGSTISHRKAECMKNKMGWRTSEEKKPYDNFANEFQGRVRNACSPAPRAGRMSGKKPQRKSSTPIGTPGGYPSPHMGYMAPPQVLSPSTAHGVNSNINIAGPSMQSIYPQPSPVAAPPGPSGPSPPVSRISTGAENKENNMVEPMDLS